MTNCPSEEILIDYTAGNLDPAQAAAFERHAEGCARCAEFRSAQAAIWHDLETWKPAPVSEGFNRELWRRIDADAAGHTGWFSGLRFNIWKAVAPLGVAVAVIVTAFVMDHSPKNVRPQPGSAVVVTASDADRLERTLDDIQLLHEVDAASTSAATKSAAIM
jgi:anti-sigma factor RsiW